MIEEIVEYRYALELMGSPFEIGLNPTPSYDHSSMYIARIIIKPCIINVRFDATSLSYVEVFDADNGRFFLPEKTEISEPTTFTLSWDGVGVFEPRIWKDSQVNTITFMFNLPDEEIIMPIKAAFSFSPFVLAGGGVLFVGGMIKKSMAKKR